MSIKNPIIMKPHSFWSKCFALLCLVALGSGNIAAQENDEPDKTLSPYFVVISENPENDQLPLKETSVKSSISGSIADVTIKQVYVNSGKHPLEAIYTFPMSTRAAVYAMQMTIGTRTIRAQIEEKKKARADYEKAKQEGKRASLLEQNRPNVFTMNVSNIMVGDTIMVELRYTELLIPENGQYSFVYPTVVGPRYSNPAKNPSGPDDGYVSTPYTHKGVMPTYKFNYELAINSAVPIQDVTCTSHKMNINNPSANRAVVRLAPSETNGGNRDVIVNYSLRGNNIESGLMLYEGQEENFFMLMVQPPKRVQKDDIPPREYIFIVDVSGSMWGFPMEISKKLMRNLLTNLNPGDKFNIILFSSNAALLSPSSVDATPENIDRAMDFIKGANQWSGTEVLDALNTAYAIPRPTKGVLNPVYAPASIDEDISRTMVILTDGYVTVESKCFELIRQNSGQANFFAFGIGSSVNRWLIEGMAFAGNGEPMIVTKEDEAAAQAERFRQYINTPVLTRIKFNPGKFQAYDIEPVSVPDMMAERPILIFGKYKGKPQGTVSLTGKVGRKPFRQTYNLSNLKADPANSALRYLWARERIKYLSYLDKDNYNDDQNPIAKQILELGLKYNLMTQYTSFVAIDEEIVNKDGKQTTVKQPVPMPEGVSDYAVGHDVSAFKVANVAAVDLSRVTSVFEEEEVEEDEVFVVVETDPQFPGGMDSLYAFIQRNLRYPEKALNDQIAGTVYISFCVEKDGSITNVKLLRDIGGGCGEEAVRVVKMMPKWIPGKQKGKPVRTQFNLPVKFKLSAK